ncbi:hypothetical protein [Arthrobacter sp. JSM 101049]|uniref:hypothetical protein n=1 Tax=Arthrobacter sp. JSM 101049 TaxID=929097 RepID=UPI0035690C08
MNIRQAIFASVASAGVLASGWLGGTATTTASAAAPSTHRLGTVAGGASSAHHRSAAASSTLSTVRRGQLRGAEPVQLLSGPGYSAAGYGLTQQAALDMSLA